MLQHHRPRALVALAYLLFLINLPHAVADAQCYAVNGQKSSGTPCNAAATGQSGSHAACCDESKQEACLATGVCFATQRSDNNTFWAEGCTDPTGLDPACPQYCGTASPNIYVTAGTPIQPTYTVMSCGGSAWCCCFDSFGKSCNKTDCCAQKNFTLARGLGAVVRQFTAVPTADNASTTTGAASSPTGRYDGNGGGGRFNFDRSQRLVTVIVAGVLGALLLAALVALGFSYSRARHLRRQVDRLQQQEKEALLIASSSLPPSSAVPSPLSTRVRSLRINTQGLAGHGGAPHPSAMQDETVSPMSHEQLHHLQQQQQQQHQQQQHLQQQQYSAGGIRRSSSSSVHQPPPPFTQQTQPYQSQHQPYVQQQLNGFSFTTTPRTPTWNHTGSFRHNSVDNNMTGGALGPQHGHSSVHGNAPNTAELASPMPVTELPAEKYTY
ncbi:uncharacterized protein SPSK_09296 [Sporothrix schenckii 1099-18]|uniref:Mid2 domain-containing protein n=2 Tax=Sporothrix schenckii TaxID=29908 RepID=U7Q711_SPOS1|nr:uncharacterized protein SPSK_09296 [Sporothrix schenckii 1099-18]ERT02967.1 hypothetical protein HMPREF1624_01271 [Sporothrix schenckii ATCC 58251]KJR84665.1 hypothetical protein SPSK_09296 [Sporothrix schenckii 1099-18]